MLTVPYRRGDTFVAQKIVYGPQNLLAEWKKLQQQKHQQHTIEIVKHEQFFE